MELILGLGMGRGSVFSFETLVLPASAQALFLSVYLLSGGVPGSAAVLGHPALCIPAVTHFVVSRKALTDNALRFSAPPSQPSARLRVSRRAGPPDYSQLRHSSSAHFPGFTGVSMPSSTVMPSKESDTPTSSSSQDSMQVVTSQLEGLTSLIQQQQSQATLMAERQEAQQAALLTFANQMAAMQSPGAPQINNALDGSTPPPNLIELSKLNPDFNDDGDVTAEEAQIYQVGIQLGRGVGVGRLGVHVGVHLTAPRSVQERICLRLITRMSCYVYACHAPRTPPLSPHTHLPHPSSPIATQVLKKADVNSSGSIDIKVFCSGRTYM